MLELALLVGAGLLLFRGQRRAAPATAQAPVVPAPGVVQQEPTAFPPVKVSIGLASETMRAVLSDLTATPQAAPRAIGSILPRPTAPAPVPMPRPQNILAHIERGYIR